MSTNELVCVVSPATKLSCQLDRSWSSKTTVQYKASVEGQASKVRHIRCVAEKTSKLELVVEGNR